MSRMGEELLATAGDTIKLWDTTSFSLCQEIPFENGRVRGLTWNQDGQCLASLGETGEEILLSAIKSKSATNIGVVRGVEAPSCIKFASRVPHYLGVGTHTGTVAIWNVKSQAKKKAFSVTDGAISRICFSHNDSHITVATKKGALYSLSVVNNAAAGPFTVFENQDVTGLSYNHIKKSLVGCCSEVGGVALFDTYARKVVHSFPQAHAAPAAAIAFSPVNEFLMVSVGYDKKFACFSVQTKETVMNHRSPAPLTSVTFLAGGQRVALGTMTGQVFVHDLRCLRPPVATLSAHASQVTAVLRQPSARSKSDSTIIGGRKAAHPSTTNNSLTVTYQKPCKSWAGQAESGKCEVKEAETESGSQMSSPEVFSPIRPTQKNVPCSPGNPTGASGSTSSDSPGFQDVFSPIRQIVDPVMESASPLTYKLWAHNIDEDDILSPIRNTEATASPMASVKPCSPVPQINLQPCDFPTRQCDKENLEPSSEQDMKNMDAHNDPHSIMMASLNPNTNSIGKQADLDGILSPLRSTSITLGNIELCDKQTRAGTPNNFQDASVSKSPSSSKVNTKCDMDLSTQVIPPMVSKNVEDWTPSTTAISDTKKTAGNTATGHPSTPLLPSHYSRTSPPKKRQLLQPIQGSDLLPDHPDATLKSEEIQNCTSTTHPLIEKNVGAVMKDGGWGMQVELLRSCVAEVVEEVHDDLNRRLLHLQYIVTKHFLRQQEVMEQLHQQYSLNEELLQENERLRQELAHLRTKY